MSSITHPIAMSAPFARSVAIAALMGATMLASPLTAARADNGTNAAIQLAQGAAPQKPAAMDKLIAANRTTPPQNMTAVEDLKMYQKFAQAHVDGLKNLISSFDKLYAGMPDAQKKIADEVFSSSRT